MEELWYSIEDVSGHRGVVRELASDATKMEVRFENGERMIVPKSHVSATASGVYRFDSSFAALLDGARTGEYVFPVIEEQIEVGKRTVERERLRVSTHVSTRNEDVDVPLFHEELEVSRVAIDRVVESTEAPRQEGDTMIVPVYHEVLVVEKRLILREEVHLKRVRREHHERRQVTLRREEVQVERGSSPAKS
jgi:uncharacterized protein (TIGR02271 family)